VVSTVGTVPGVSTTDPERGLLGIAVDPGWPSRPYLYTQSTDERSGNHIAISRFTCTGDLTDVSSRTITFDPATRYDLRADFPDDQGNHNGGTLRFGIDGKLYSSLGDDASYCPALDITVAVGKILRLDVSRIPPGPGGPAPYAMIAAAGNPYATNADSVARLVWASGLRNPFRFNVDPASGMLVIGDVGLDHWEELDLQTYGGADFEWPLKEGPATLYTCTNTGQDPMVDPVAYYPHPDGAAIIGGPRYRIPAAGTLPFPSDYEGDVFYSDYYGGFIRRLNYNGTNWVPEAAPGQPDATNWATGMEQVSDLLELSDGSIWYCRQYPSFGSPGEIRRISFPGDSLPPPGPGPSQPVGIAMDPPRPNPSHDDVTLSWTQPDVPRVVLTIYGTDGRRVRSLIDETSSPAASRTATWDGLDDHGRRVRPGIYIARLELGGEVRKTRITRLPAAR
jgi:hypothetical protein